MTANQRGQAGSLAGNGNRGRRSQELSAAVAEAAAGGGSAEGPDRAEQEERLREQAKALGLNLQRPGRRGGFRPRADGNGKVRQTISMSLPVREGLEQACWQLDVNYSDMVERALAHYFQALGLHFEGVPAVGAEAAET